MVRQPVYTELTGGLAGGGSEMFDTKEKKKSRPEVYIPLDSYSALGERDERKQEKQDG